VELPIYPEAPDIKKTKGYENPEETGQILWALDRGRLSLNPKPDDIIKESSILLQ